LAIFIRTHKETTSMCNPLDNLINRPYRTSISWVLHVTPQSYSPKDCNSQNSWNLYFKLGSGCSPNKYTIYQASTDFSNTKTPP